VKILCVDVEASCWGDHKNGPNGETSEIIEIGYALVGHNNRIDQTGTRMVRPAISTELSEFCTTLTTLTWDNVKDGLESPVAAMKSITEELTVTQPERLAWASWGDYDRKMLAAAGVKLGRHLNVAPMYAYLAGLSKSGGLRAAVEATVGWEGQHHRGDADALNLARLLVYLKRQFSIGNEVLNLVVKAEA
jgi:inhibitor of KinA sporulation pathway (predicted exonuclease)